MGAFALSKMLPRLISIMAAAHLSYCFRYPIDFLI